VIFLPVTQAIPFISFWTSRTLTASRLKPIVEVSFTVPTLKFIPQPKSENTQGPRGAGKGSSRPSRPSRSIARSRSAWSIFFGQRHGMDAGAVWHVVDGPKRA